MSCLSADIRFSYGNLGVSCLRISQEENTFKPLGTSGIPFPPECRLLILRLTNIFTIFC